MGKLRIYNKKQFQKEVFMENSILKNQKELYDNLPSVQIGSKFTKLQNRFASKTNYPLNIKLPIKNPNLSQYPLVNKQLQQNEINRKKKHKKTQSSFEQSQLQYFKSINTQIKHQNLMLKQDLKLCNEKLIQTIQQKKMTEQKLSVYHQAINRSQKKINSLMGLAHQLILIVKDKYWDKNDNTNTKNVNVDQTSNHCSPFEQKRIQMQRQLDRMKQITQNKRNSQKSKKCSMALMIQQSGDNYIKKSTFSTHTQSFCGGKQCQENQHQYSQFLMKQKQKQKQQIQMNELVNTIDNFEKEIKQMRMFEHIMEGITKTFSDQSLNMQYETQNKQKQIEKSAKNYVLQQIGTYFTKLMQKHKQQFHSNLKLQSKVHYQKIKPTFTFYRLYASIKQILDHQIYLLQNQKMLFLQYKNKRLLKFIYQCSGCQRYEQMFNQIFRIMREGFKQIKCKVMPEFRSKNWEDSQGQFLI